MLLSNGTFSETALGGAAPSYAGTVSYARDNLALNGLNASYGAVYRAQPWISTLVNKIAFGTARLPLKVYERKPDNSRQEARTSPLAALLREPNPRHDPFFFWLWTVSTFEVYGEAIWIKIRPRPGAAPTQLWPLHPANVTVRRNDDGELRYYYIYGASAGQFLEWSIGDVVHFRSYNPDDLTRGMSRLEPLRQTVLNEDASRRASAAMWKNGGRPSMAMMTPKTLGEPARQRLKAEINSLHAGVDNWGKIALLEEGLEPKLFPLNAEEMQYIEARQISREEACGVYDVPPPVVHILDHATFSNITEQMRSMYRDTMAPRLGLYESVLNAQLRPDFNPRGDLYIEFLLDEVMRGAFEQRAIANQAAIFSGQRTPDEVRRQDNLPPLPGGDRLYINAAAVPLDATRSQQTVPAPRNSADTDLCVSCLGAPQSSARGLCRSCEGRASRMLTNTAEGVPADA